MAVSGGPLSNGGPPVNSSLPRVLETVEQLSSHVKDFQDLIDLRLLVPQLIGHGIITREERHQLMHETDPPETRILSLVTIILPKKGEGILQQFKAALENTLKEDGSQGHQTLLEKFFGLPPKVHNGSTDGVHHTTAETVSDESEAFSVLLMKFQKTLESGNEKEVSRRLRDIANYLCHLKNKNNSFLLTRNVRDGLCSNDLTFSKLFNYLDSSDPPIITDNDVSMLHKIIDRVLVTDEGCKKIIMPLKQLLNEYEQDAGITISTVDPPISPGSARIKAKVVNAKSGGPKIKNGVKKSLWHSFWLNFRGSGVGSVVFYWDFPEEYITQVKESLEKVCHDKAELHQLRIIKVEVHLKQKPYQIDLDMEITDPVLLKDAQKRHLVADDIAPEQENFVLFLIKIDRLVGTCAELFLSTTTRKEYSRLYAQFEGSSFEEMTDTLIHGDKLHYCDISYIQQFLLSLLKWDISQDGNHKEVINASLKAAQDYEPVPTGSLLPSVRLHNKSHAIDIFTTFFGVNFVSYEVMMALKYALSQLLYLSPSTFQYAGWRKVNKDCQITWKTGTQNFEKIASKLSHYPSTAALEVAVSEVNFEIDFSCNIKNMQILLDGSPVLSPDLDGKCMYMI